MPPQTEERQELERLAEYGKRGEPSNLDALLYLGIEHDDMYDQIKMNRMQQVLDFAYQYKDGLDVLRKVVIKHPRRERVDAAWEYMQMRKEYTRRTEGVRGMEAQTEDFKMGIADLRRNIEAMER